MRSKSIGRTLAALIVAAAISVLGVGTVQAASSSSAAMSCEACTGPAFSFTAECMACCGGEPGWCPAVGNPCLCF